VSKGGGGEMNGLREVYEYVVDMEGRLWNELERVRDWQKKARARMSEDRKWLGRVDYGELEAASKSFLEVKAQLAIAKLVKEKIEEVLIREKSTEVK
jgi:hypothetical protein